MPSATDTSTESSRPSFDRLRRRTAEELADYATEVGALLTRYGCPAYRIESLIRVLADVEEHDGDAFALPTGLFVTITPRGGRMPPVHRMTRLHAWSVDLDKLLVVDDVFNEVAAGTRTIEDARDALRGIDARPPAYPAWLSWIAAALTSAAAAVFFRGRLVDVAFAAATGLLLRALASTLGTHPQARFLGDFLGALVASLAAGLAARVVPLASREVILLAGMIALFPGMTFTTGLAEIAQKNLVAGNARLAEALFTFLALVFGIALAVTVAGALGLTLPDPPPRVALGLPFQLAAVAGISVGLGIAFGVPRKLLWTALVSAGLSYGVTAIATRHLPAHIAAFLAATVVCSVANLLARHTNRPAQLYHLPGMMLLVPGSLGFLSLEDIMRGTYISGAERGVAMVLVAGGLVMGVLAANVLFSPRKLL